MEAGDDSDDGPFDDDWVEALPDGQLTDAVRRIRQPQVDLIARQMESSVKASLLKTQSPLTLGRFSIIEKIGGGGMGVVYAAYDRKLERKVALKVLRADRRDQGGFCFGRPGRWLGCPTQTSSPCTTSPPTETSCTWRWSSWRGSRYGSTCVRGSIPGTSCSASSSKRGVASPRRTRPGWCTGTSSPPT